MKIGSLSLSLMMSFKVSKNTAFCLTVVLMFLCSCGVEKEKVQEEKKPRLKFPVNPETKLKKAKVKTVVYNPHELKAREYFNRYTDLKQQLKKAERRGGNDFSHAIKVFSDGMVLISKELQEKEDFQVGLFYWTMVSGPELKSRCRISGDGKKVVYTSKYGLSPADTNQLTDLYFWDVAGKRFKYLSNNKYSTDFKYEVLTPSISFDGSKVAYFCKSHQNPRNRLCTFDYIHNHQRLFVHSPTP